MQLSERRTKPTSTISDVRVVPVPRVLVPISRMKQMQTMRLLSLFLTTLGGVVAGCMHYSSWIFYVGIAMILLGFANEYLNVQRIMSKWEKHKPIEVNINDTATETTEYE